MNIRIPIENGKREIIKIEDEFLLIPYLNRQFYLNQDYYIYDFTQDLLIDNQRPFIGQKLRKGKHEISLTNYMPSTYHEHTEFDYLILRKNLILDEIDFRLVFNMGNNLQDFSQHPTLQKFLKTYNSNNTKYLDGEFIWRLKLQESSANYNFIIHTVRHLGYWHWFYKEDGLPYTDFYDIYLQFSDTMEYITYDNDYLFSPTNVHGLRELEVIFNRRLNRKICPKLFGKIKTELNPESGIDVKMYIPGSFFVYAIISTPGKLNISIYKISIYSLGHGQYHDGVSNVTVFNKKYELNNFIRVYLFNNDTINSNKVYCIVSEA